MISDYVPKYFESKQSESLSCELGENYIFYFLDESDTIDVGKFTLCIGGKYL